MSLSTAAKRILRQALGNAAAATEISSVVDAMASASASYVRLTAGTKILIPQSTVDRQVMIVATVNTVFATGDGSQPTFAIGQTGTISKFAATSQFTAATAGTIKMYAGVLNAGQDLIVTATAATGTTSTGALGVVAIAMK